MKYRESDITDNWNDNKFIHEGDVCLLHNWGFDHQDEIIAVAELRWDSEDHAWDFDFIAGNRIDDRYDLWRTCPRVIYSDEKIVDPEFKNMFKWTKLEWESWLKEQHNLAEAKAEKKRKAKLINDKKKRIDELKSEIAKVEQQIKEAQQ